MRYQNYENKGKQSERHYQPTILIGGEKWRNTVAKFEEQQGRKMTKPERLELERLLCGKVATVKTKGRATDLRCKGGDTGSALRSESLRGGIAADNDKGVIVLRKKAGKLVKPVTAK